MEFVLLAAIAIGAYFGIRGSQCVKKKRNNR